MTWTDDGGMDRADAAAGARAGSGRERDRVGVDHADTGTGGVRDTAGDVGSTETGAVTGRPAGTDTSPGTGGPASTETNPGGLASTGTGTGAGETAALRAEVAGLRQALSSHPVIDMARGIVMATAGCTPEEAWRVLVDVSQHTNVKLREIARQIVESTYGPPPPAPVRAAMRAAYAELPGRSH